MKKKWEFIFFFLLFLTIVSPLSAKPDQHLSSSLFEEMKIPIEWFDGTTEGITESELAELLKNNQSKYWIVRLKKARTIEFEHKDDPSQKVLVVLKKAEKNKLIAVVGSENQSAINTQTWQSHRDTKSQKFDHFEKNDKLIAPVSVNDFLLKKEHLEDPEYYRGNVHYFLEKNGNIDVSLYTWMEPELVKKTIAYSIKEIWRNGHYVVKKRRITVLSF